MKLRISNNHLIPSLSKQNSPLLAAFLNMDLVHVISQASLLQISTRKKRKPSCGVNLSAETQLLQMKFALFNYLTAEIQQRNTFLKLTN